MRAWILALTLFALPSGKAHAAERSEFENRPTAVYGQLGLGTPLGFVGIEAEHTVVPIWSVSAGAGLGLGGPQAAVMTRGLFGGHWSKFVIGGGLSGGRYLWVEPFCIENDCTRKSGTVAWGNLEIGGAHRFRSGFAMKYFGGYGRLIAGDLVCDEAETYGHCTIDHKNDGYNLIYTGVAVGYAF